MLEPVNRVEVERLMLGFRFVVAVVALRLGRGSGLRLRVLARADPDLG